MSVLLMADQLLKNKRVLIREDFNVPVKEGVISSDARIQAALPTIQQAISQGAQLILMSHLGRPEEGGVNNQPYSLAPVAARLEKLLGKKVDLINDWKGSDQKSSSELDKSLEAGHICLLENVRFNQGEKSNDDDLAKSYASLCDIFVMDAFGTAHRAQASTHGVAKFSPIACAGPLLAAELDALERALASPARPVVAIVGGSKVSTKLAVLETLADKVDQLVVGGGIANTFLAAAGKPVGKSLCEFDLIDTAKALAAKISIPLPTDVVTAKAFSEQAIAEIKNVNQVEDDDLILDIGPESATALGNILREAKTIIWNGPVGVFEFDQFAEGTRSITQAIVESDGFSIAGGGDTLAAIDKYHAAEKISYISTGGGAFLEFVEGKTLPAVEVLEQRAKG